MKKFIFPLIALFALLTANSCSEKFNIAAPYKNITVVYGFLEMQDTAHYIRIQKAFLSQDKSALVMSKTADSSFYANLNVKIKRFTFTDNVHVVDTIHLNRVDLDLEGYPKQAGSFFTAPNYAYKFKDTLDPNYIYRLVITNLTTGKSDSAETAIINDGNPNEFNVDMLDDNRILFGFPATVGNKYVEMQGSFRPPFGFSYHGITNPVAIEQSIVRFHWDDSNINTHELVPHYADYNVGFQQVAANGNIDVKIFNNSLYGTLASAMGTAPAGIARLLSKVEVFVYLSTPDYVAYQQSSLTQGTGLTGSEIEPIYTNISGENTIGLFTSRGVRSALKTITHQTIDSLIISNLLHPANIQGRYL